MATTNKTTHTDVFRFVGAQEYIASGSASELPWRKTLVGSATVGNVAGGVELELVTTAEGESARLSFGDILSYDIDDLVSIEFLFNLTSAAFTNSTVFLGMASAGNATIDTIGEMAGFRMDATLALKAESDDGTNNNDDVATGLTLTSGLWTRARIDFATGVQTVGPPGISKGGKGCLLFSAGQGAVRPVLRNSTLFDMSNYTGGLQPYVQYQKALSADAGTLVIKEILVETRQFV